MSGLCTYLNTSTWTMSILVLFLSQLNADRTLNTCFPQQLENSLNEFGEKWVLNPGDGAFYGPKVSHAMQISDTL